MARISGVDLPRDKKVEIGLTYIFGIGRHNATDIMAEGGDKNFLKAEAGNVREALRAGKDVKKGDFPHLKVEDSTELKDEDLSQKFVDVIRKTPVGSFSDPVETEFGWTILKVEERKEAKPLPYDDARSKIYNTLLQQRSEKYEKSFLEDLRKHSYIVINPSAS